MIIESPENKRIINDYDIVSVNGMLLPVSVDLEAGDTIDFNGEAILVHLVSKPSQTDPNKMLPAEDITVFKIHVFSVQRREREVIDQTPEQKAAWTRVLQEMSETLQ